MHAVESRIQYYSIRYKLEHTKFDCEYLRIFSNPRPTAGYHNSYQFPKGQPAKAARRIVWLCPCIFVIIIERCEQLKRMCCSPHLCDRSLAFLEKNKIQKKQRTAAKLRAHM